MTDWLPHINASLNGLATVLLALGLIAIKGKRETLHRNLLLSCFGVSAVFLVCYLAYHAQVGSKKFPAAEYPIGVWIYYPILASHVILAAAVPVLAVWSIVLGLKDQREKHRRIVKWAFPIWMYVSVTGVMVYAMLYWVFPPPVAAASEVGVQAIRQRSAVRLERMVSDRTGNEAAVDDSFSELI